jgi:3-oxoacyl-[acyl-carrier protein] reductase
MESLSGKSFLLLGGNGAIGSAVARRLHRRGAQLVLAGRNAAALQALAAELSAQVVPVEAREPDTVAAAVSETVRLTGRLDGAANFCGTVLLKPAHLTTDAEWNDTLAVNLTSAFALTRAAVRAFPATGGSMVFLSTVAARVGLPNHEAIAAAKAGLIGLALSAAATYAHKGIRFNVVAPGLVRTPLTAKITANEAALKASTQMHPLGRIGEPDEVAAAVEWFLDPAQSWVTGQVLGIDGGLGSVRGRTA